MKNNHHINSLASPKNVANKVNNKNTLQSCKSSLPFSSKNTEKAQLSSTTDTQPCQHKDEKNMRVSNSQISTEDIQRKHSEQELTQQNQNSKMGQNHTKKGWMKNGRGNEKKDQYLGSPKHSSVVSGRTKEKWRGQDQNSAETSFKQMQNSFLKQINELEVKKVGFEKQASEKDKIIDQLKKQNKQLQEKYQKLSQINTENRKILKEKVLKFNEEGDEVRKLRQRIHCLETEVLNLKAKQSTPIQSEDYFPKVNEVESQVLSQWLSNSQLDFSQSQIFKMIHSKHSCSKIVDNDENVIARVKKDYDESLAEIEGKFNRIVEEQERKISQKEEVIKELREKVLDCTNFSTVESEIESLKNENFRLRNNLISNLKSKMEQKSKRSQGKNRRRHQIKQCLQKIMEISTQQKYICEKINPIPSIHQQPLSPLQP